MPPQYPHVEAGLRYAKAVVSRQIPACKWVRLACKRQLNDLKRKYNKDKWPFIFDLEKAERVCRFMELLPHIKGEWAGKKIKLEDWQCFYLSTKYGWVYKETGFRRFRTSYMEVPRKNAKSTISSGEMLYSGSADGEMGAECYSAATTKQQARIVFDVAQKMAQRSREFRDKYGVRVRAHDILVSGTDSILTPVSAEAGNLDGLNVHYASIDELHAHKTRAVYDVIETGAGARAQSMISIITTAGTDITGICYELHEYLCKVLEGVFTDESFFGLIYTVDMVDKWASEDELKKANPNYGISVKAEYLQNLLNKAKRSPASAANFKTKHLNIWAQSDTAWMDMEKWRKCGGVVTKLDDFKGEKCWIGLDLSSKIDVSALVLLFYRNGLWYPFGRYYLPEDLVEEKEGTTHSHYRAWAETGRFVLTPGNVIDIDFIEEDIRDICTKFDVQSIAYDPWQATQLATHLMADRLPMVEMRQITANMTEPMKQLEALVHARKMRHGDCPVLTWMISNVVAHYDKKDNIYPNKEKHANKIDGAIALIMALARAILQGDEPASVYETRGIVTA